MSKKFIRIYYVFDKQFQLKCTGVCMIKKTNVCSHSYFFLPKAYPNIWRAQLLSPESGELAHSNMYFRTSGHVMLSSSSSKKQRLIFINFTSSAFYSFIYFLVTVQCTRQEALYCIEILFLSFFFFLKIPQYKCFQNYQNYNLNP